MAMMLDACLRALFPANQAGDWLLQDDGAGPYIKAWNRTEPQPTMAELDAVQIPEPVPAEVTRRQALQAMRLSGIASDAVQASIAAIADPLQRDLMQIEWSDSQTFQRSRPSLIALAHSIGLSEAQLDQLFIQAGALP